MASRATSVLRLIQSAVNADGLGASDRDLLHRFAQDNDQSAFAALVRRHGGMVLGACRRALPNLQDAEDAFQATFLVLAKKAGATRWEPSIANWLFTTARRVSRNARVAAQRRARREARAAVPDVVLPIDQMTGRELLAALDQELERLPPRYREPLILCYLEGLSRDEAAARLGAPPATLKTWLERGRKRLGDALTRRGCALGAGLLALAASSQVGAASSRLVESALAAAGGGAAAALTKGIAVKGLMHKSLLVLVLVAASLGAGLWLVSPPAAGQRPDRGPAQAVVSAKGRAAGTDKSGDRESVIAGRVLGPDGKPVAKATIYLYGWIRYQVPARPEVVATTDADGRFTYDSRRTPAKWRNATLVAVGMGGTPDWALLSGAGRELTLRLAPDVPIRGRLLDLEGKPVGGAVVKVVHIGAFADGNLQPALNAMRLNPEWTHYEKNIDAFAPAFAGQTKTKADGRFTLAGIGKDRVAVLRFEAPGIEHARVHVVTQPGFDPKVVIPGPRDKAMRSGFVPGLRPTVYGPSFTHPVRPSHDITGTVVDALTGKPVPNVRIVGTASPTYAGGEPYWEGAVETKTDRAGKYRLTGLSRASRRYLRVEPGDNPYLDRLIEVKDTEALTPATVEIKLEGCVVLEGRIIDKVTGKGVKGEAHYLPLTENTDLKTLADARLYKGGLFTARPTGTWASSDDEGKFKLRVLHSWGVVLARADTDRDPSARYPAVRVAKEDRKYLYKRSPDAISTRKKMSRSKDRSEDEEAFRTASVTWPLRWENGYAIINPGAKETLKLTVRLDPGRTITGKVLGPDGKPVRGALAIGVQATNEQRATTFRGDAFTAYALVPGVPREMVFLHQEKKLAGVLTVRAEDRQPTVKLQPWAVLVGRVVPPDGSPAANAEVGFQFTDGIADELIRQKLHRDRQRLRTGKDGRFRIEGMFPGQEVWVSAHAAGLRSGAGSQPVIPKVGETVDVGDIKLPAP